jgi:cell division protease FtsH
MPPPAVIALSLQEVEAWVLTWVPLIFMGLIVVLIGLTLRYMPRTKPQEIKPQSSDSIGWDDVAGVEEAKAELREVVDFMRDPKRFKRLGAKVPKGILLHGPPDTGKTLLAKAVARESKRQVLRSVSVVVRRNVPGSARRASVASSASRASRRPQSSSSTSSTPSAPRAQGHLGREGPDSQPAPRRDGRVREADNIVVIAASNLLDSSTRRCCGRGHFDRQIFVSPPDLTGRRAILRVHSVDKPLGGVDIELIARQTSGLTGADLANICNEAAIFAGRSRRDTILMGDFEAVWSPACSRGG